MGEIKDLAEPAPPILANNIEAVRLELAAWSERQPKPVQNAVANLGGWLEVAADHHRIADYHGVDVLASTARAVERLRRAVRGSVLSAYGRSDG